MLKSTKFKTRALILITAVGLVGASHSAFAHTRLKNTSNQRKFSSAW